MQKSTPRQREVGTVIGASARLHTVLCMTEPVFVMSDYVSSIHASKYSDIYVLTLMLSCLFFKAEFADLVGADLVGADLVGADLVGADLVEGIWVGGILVADLVADKGLVSSRIGGRLGGEILGGRLGGR